MKVRIDPPDECMGDGICSDECPEVFELNEDGLAIVINAEPDESLREAVESAAEECPAEIIIVED